MQDEVKIFMLCKELYVRNFVYFLLQECSLEQITLNCCIHNSVSNQLLHEIVLNMQRT